MNIEPTIHYNDVIMGAIAAQITSLSIVYSIVYSDADQRKHQSSASLAFVRDFTGDQWIPCTNGQLRGKCFHLITSSCTCRHSQFLHNEPPSTEVANHDLSRRSAYLPPKWYPIYGISQRTLPKYWDHFGKFITRVYVLEVNHLSATMESDIVPVFYIFLTSYELTGK